MGGYVESISKPDENGIVIAVLHMLLRLNLRLDRVITLLKIMNGKHRVRKRKSQIHGCILGSIWNE